MTREVRQFRAIGRVQGVGFRWFVRETARSIQLTGWVRNEQDGSVLVVAAGTPEQLYRLSAALRDGPAGASVHRVDERLMDDAEDTSAASADGAPDAMTQPFQMVRSRSSA